MRRLTVLLFLALAAPAHALRLTTPDTTVGAHPYAASLSAEIEIKGRARRNALVEVRAVCQRGTCRAALRADRKGRFDGWLSVVLPPDQRRIRLRALSGDQEFSAIYPLVEPAYAAAPPFSDDADAPELVVIGDSLAVGTEPPLRADLPGWRFTSNARVGRPLSEGMTVLGMTPLPSTPRALAFGLFTNDDPRNVDTLETAVRASLARLGSEDCALWATIVRPKVRGYSYAAANRRLKALADEDDRLRIVDWAAAVKRHHGWLAGDGVHGTTQGYAGRARLFATAAEECQADNDWGGSSDGTDEGGSPAPPQGSRANSA